MKTKRPPNAMSSILHKSGVRPTRQRLALAALLFDGTHKHMTADDIHSALVKNKTPMALATVYNTLRHFTASGLVHQVCYECRVYFDTNVEFHHHMYDRITGQLYDVPEKHVHIARLPPLPSGRRLDRIDVMIHLQSE
jgi:Fur family iron response transcriptional regulator